MLAVRPPGSGRYRTLDSWGRPPRLIVPARPPTGGDQLAVRSRRPSAGVSCRCSGFRRRGCRGGGGGLRRRGPQQHRHVGRRAGGARADDNTFRPVQPQAGHAVPRGSARADAARAARRQPRRRERSPSPRNGPLARSSHWPRPWFRRSPQARRGSRAPLPSAARRRVRTARPRYRSPARAQAQPMTQPPSLNSVPPRVRTASARRARQVSPDRRPSKPATLRHVRPSPRRPPCKAAFEPVFCSASVPEDYRVLKGPITAYGPAPSKHAEAGSMLQGRCAR